MNYSAVVLMMGLGAGALLGQAGCQSCESNYGDLSFRLTVTLVDDAGTPLAAEDFTARLEAAELSACVEGRDADQCRDARVDERDAAVASFTVVATGEAYDNGSAPETCSFPDVGITIELPGCGRREAWMQGGAGKGESPTLSNDLTIVCEAL
jgi:hypothetical protein